MTTACPVGATDMEHFWTLEREGACAWCGEQLQPADVQSPMSRRRDLNSEAAESAGTDRS